MRPGLRGGLGRGRAAPGKRLLGSLSAQFLVAGGLLLLVAMLFAGYVISTLVARSTINHKAAATALFMQSLVAPFTDELASAGHLSPASSARLDALLSSEQLKDRFPYFEIWKPDGTVAYSNSTQIIGQRFPRSAGLSRALKGEVVADYADLRAGEHRVRDIDTPFLEIYSPIRSGVEGHILGVAEIHEFTQPLQQDLANVRWGSWLVVAGSTLAIMLGLYGIVRRGSRTIEAQHTALEARIAEAERLAMLNQSLRERLQRASARVAELNEQFIRTVGAELHDGPAQLVGFSKLKLDEISAASNSATRGRLVQHLGTVLSQALHEIRTIAKGLLLPDLAGLPLQDVIARAVSAHEARTNVQVALAIEAVDIEVSDAVRACVFRFVQEGLNNAFRHAAGASQYVSSTLSGTMLSVAVANDGSVAVQDDAVERDRDRLGLQGLRHRIESLGGAFTAEFRQSGETRISMSLELVGGLLEH